MTDDAISRQAVLKLLAAMPPEEATTKAMLIQSVKQMEAAQPEIIRCRDCEYWHDVTPVNLKGYQYCHAFRDMMPKDGYCHKAQRREVSE